MPTGVPLHFDVGLVIPARLHSTRFPRKVLADIAGKPMIQWVYERSKNDYVDEIYVATEDDEVVDVVRGFGGKAINTGKAPTVLHRCSLAAANEILNHHEIIVVVQGDEPLVSSGLIRSVIANLGPMDLNCAFKPLEDDEDPADRNLVKVTLKKNMTEMAWLSRSPIPAVTPEGDYGFRPVYHRQVCVMAFRTEVLMRYRHLLMRNNEAAEGIDILRFIEHGYDVGAVYSSDKSYSVDTPEDLEQVKRFLK